MHINPLDFPHFDFIGDLHGCVDGLIPLLEVLGYEKKAHLGGTWCHPTRKVVFCGDLIDRGTQEKDLLDLVRSMVEHHQALICLGNHEFNAIGYSLMDPLSKPADPDYPRYLRPRNKNKTRQHQAFLDEFPVDTPLYQDVIDWFKTIPFWIDFGEVRAIHACWSPKYQEQLKPYLSDQLTVGSHPNPELFRPSSLAYEAVEFLIKGQEGTLPNGAYIKDGHGVERTEIRLKWWGTEDQAPQNWADLFVEGIPPQNLNIDAPLPDNFEMYQDPTPLFFGHYQRSGSPHLLAPNAICLDWNYVKGNAQVAYRWTRGESIDPKNLIAVYHPQSQVN